MESINGVPVTDEMIQEWADEAERGYDVEVLKKRGLVAAVDQRAEKDGTSRSEIIRSAVRAFVA